MITLIKTDLTPDQFREWYMEAFHDEDVPIPAILLKVMDGEKRVGFCSVYVHSRGTLYLQYLGFAKDAAPGKKYGYYTATLKALHGQGFPFIMGAINSKNHRALMWALRSGWTINGCRQATSGDLYVEVLKKWS